jgi:hypothetical protein
VTYLNSSSIEIKTASWEAGAVAWHYLRDSQLDIYRLLLNEKRPFIEAARRFGKTTSILCFVIEQLRRNPGWICRWCFPFKNQAREVLIAEMAKLQRLCPDKYKFVYQTTDSVFIGPGESKLYLRGVNEDKGESARGPASNIIVADEYGFWNEPDYIIKEVLSPQLQNQEGRWLIKASTPPRNLGHLYYQEREDAVRRGRFIQKTILQNEALSEEEHNEIIEECGGVNSPSYRRERLCEPVSDPDSLIIPEFSDANIVPIDYPRPDFFDAYVAGDSGADDNTALLFAYYDFTKNEVVIEREWVDNGKTTAQIIQIAKAIEDQVWGTKKPFKRVYDADKQLIYDIVGDHDYSVTYPRKEDKLAAIHELRVEVQSLRFKIKENCTQTIRQLKVGMWKDDRHTDFERSEGLGHLDAIAASIYLNRAIDRSRNPIPRFHGHNLETSFIPTSETHYRSKNEQALASVFRPKRSFK